VRYAETDAAGVVYYANYLAYFEVARVEWLRALGLPIREAEARGVLLPAVEATVRYVQPARLDDRLQIRVWPADIRRASFGFRYEVCRGDDLIARGYTRHAVVERDGLRPLALPDWVRDLLGRAQATAPVRPGQAEPTRQREGK
jgi:acyl-CoA thioester hydrolase